VVTDADGVEGSAVTVTVLVAVALEQPPVPAFVYVIVAVPVLIPETTPEEFTVAIEVVPEVHVPPATVVEKVVIEPTHTF
jgi:hypothetical protein